MLKKLTNILFSTRLTATLFVLFAAAMAVGTFLDAGQETSPTPYTRNLIYNAWWFEAIMAVYFYPSRSLYYTLYWLRRCVTYS